MVEEGFPEKMTADLTLEKQEVLRPRRKSSQISGNMGQNIQPVCSGSPGLIPKPAAGPCHHSQHRHSPDSPQEHMYKHQMNKLTTRTHAFFLWILRNDSRAPRRRKNINQKSLWGACERREKQMFLLLAHLQQPPPRGHGEAPPACHTDLFLPKCIPPRSLRCLESHSSGLTASGQTWYWAGPARAPAESSSSCL